MKRVKTPGRIVFPMTLREENWLKCKRQGRHTLEAMFDDDENVVPDEFYWYHDQLPFGTTINITFDSGEEHGVVACFDLKLYKDYHVKQKLEVMSRLEAMFDDGRNVLPEEYYWFTEDIPVGTTILVTMEVVPKVKKHKGTTE